MAKRETVAKLTETLGERTAAKWTPERIERMADEMLEWWLADETRMCQAEFWATRDDVTWYPNLPSYLCTRSETFMRIHARCKLIQEARLVRLGLTHKGNGFAEFMLMNVAGYAPRSGVNIKNDNRKVLPSVQFNLGQPAPSPNAIDIPAHVIPPELPANSRQGELPPSDDNA